MCFGSCLLLLLSLIHPNLYQNIEAPNPMCSSHTFCSNVDAICTMEKTHHPKEGYISSEFTQVNQAQPWGYHNAHLNLQDTG